MLQSAKTAKFATRRLQKHFNAKQLRASLLNISFAPNITDIIHLLLQTSKVNPSFEANFIGPSSLSIQPKKQVESLGVIIDYRLTFRSQVLALAATLKSAIMALKNLLRIKGTTIFTVYHLAFQTVIPAGFWGSEIWWTGTCQVLDRVQPAYNDLAQVIIQLPPWTPMHHLLPEAGLPPLGLYLTLKQQKYGLRILRNCAHPLHEDLLLLLKTPL